MSWSFVGRQTGGTGWTINGATSGTAGVITSSTVVTWTGGAVQGGDIIFIAIQNTTGGAGTTCAVAGFTALSNQDSGSASANDKLWVGWRVAAGAAGSATSDSTFAITLGATTWAEFDIAVWRSTLGVGVITYAPVAKNGTRTATL